MGFLGAKPPTEEQEESHGAASPAPATREACRRN